MIKKANEFILLYHTAAKDDIAKQPKAAKMFCGGKMALHFQQKREHLQAILPRDVHFDERTLTFLHRIDNIDLRNSASGRMARVRTISDANAEVHTGGPKMTNAEKLTLGKARLPHPHGRDRGNSQRQVRPSGRQPGYRGGAGVPLFRRDEGGSEGSQEP